MEFDKMTSLEICHLGLADAKAAIEHFERERVRLLSGLTPQADVQKAKNDVISMKYWRERLRDNRRRAAVLVDEAVWTLWDAEASKPCPHCRRPLAPAPWMEDKIKDRRDELAEAIRDEQDREADLKVLEATLEEVRKRREDEMRVLLYTESRRDFALSIVRQLEADMEQNGG